MEEKDKLPDGPSKKVVTLLKKLDSDIDKVCVGIEKLAEKTERKEMSPHQMAAFTASVTATVPALAASLYALASASLTIAGVGIAALGTGGLALTAVFPILSYVIYHGSKEQFELYDQGQYDYMSPLPKLKDVGIEGLKTELNNLLKSNIAVLDEAIHELRPKTPQTSTDNKSQDFVRLLNEQEQVQTTSKER